MATRAAGTCLPARARCGEVRVDLDVLSAEELVLGLVLLVLLMVLGRGRSRVGRTVGRGGAERTVRRREPEGLRCMRRLWRALRGCATATAAAAATTAASTAAGTALGRRTVAAVVALGQLVVGEAGEVEGLDEGDVGHRVWSVEGTASSAQVSLRYHVERVRGECR